MMLSFLVAVPRASGKGSMGWHTQNWACIPAPPLSYGEKPQGKWAPHSYSLFVLVCPNEITLPALRASWKD